MDPAKFKKALSKYTYPLQPTGFITTRVPYLDYAIGRPGIPLSRLSIITGVEASGKTTIALQVAAQTQQQGGVVTYLDAEHKLDTDYASVLGVNVDDMVLIQPSYMEQTFKAMARSVEAALAFPDISPQKPALIILDSMNAMVTKAELEGDWDSVDVAPGARVMSRLLKKLLGLIAVKPISLLFISQVRTSIGAVSFTSKVACGWSPKFYSACTIELKRKKGGIIKSKGEPIGSTIEGQVIKSQIGKPFQKCDFDIIWGSGVDYNKNLCDLALHLGIIELKGLSYAVEWKGKTYKWGKRQDVWVTKYPKIYQMIQNEIAKRIKP